MTYPTIMPALTLDFQNSQQLDPRVTFSRSSGGSYINSAGQVAYAAEHEPRFDHDGNGECLGLLFEEASSNLITTSNLATPSYNNGGASAPVAYADSRFGTLSNAFEFTYPSGTITNYQWGWGYSLPQATQYTLSYWVKASEDCQVQQGGSRNVTTDWQYFTETYTTGGSLGGGTVGLVVTLVQNSIYNNALPDGVTLYYANVQLEPKSFATSYIPSDTNTVIRSEDIAQVTTADIYGDEFTIINTPFGVSSGGPTLHLQGHPHVERAAVYNGYLSQEQINTVAGVDEFWMWRVLGSSWEIKPTIAGSVTVDWGDGTTEPLSHDVAVNHTFTNGSGYHEVGFRLDSGSWFSVNLNYGNPDSREQVVAVGPMPANMATTGYYSYNYCSNITAWDANLVHTYGGPNSYQLGRTYAGLTSLKSFPFTVLDPLITSLSQAWRDCSNLNSFPLIDTSLVDNFGESWKNCSSLTSFPLLDTSSGEKFKNAWDGCTNLTSFPLLDTSSGTNFQASWKNCRNLESFPLIDTSSGSNLSFSWVNCEKLTSFPAIDTSLATTLHQAWNGCTGLTSFPLLDTSLCENLGSAWAGCSNITGAFPSILTPSATLMSYTWAGCSGLTSFPLIDTTNCTGSFTDTWINCSGLTSFPAIVCNGSTYNEAWRGCSSLTTFPPNMFDAGTVTPGIGHGKSFNNAWQGCALTAQSIENILVSLDVSGVIDSAVGIHQGTNAAQSSWSTAANTALANLQAKGWTVTYNT
jgi:hypothetical protein